MVELKASVLKLYLDACKLAYTETMLAISPRLPFRIADRPTLRNQADEMANEAKRLRGLDPGAIDQTKVDAALNSVAAAQAIFDVVNNQTGNSYSTAQVFGIVTTAVAAVRAI